MKKIIVIALMVAFICSTGKANIVNGSFETDTPFLLPNEVFKVYGHWGYDLAEIVDNENGIFPLHGNHMLHFVGTTPYDDPSYGVVGCDIWQLIDISSYDTSSGNVTAAASAYFNRVQLDEFTDTLFEIRLVAWDGQWTQLASVSNAVITDNEIDSWEECDTVLTIPSNSDFLGIRIRSVENIYNDTITNEEFDGHYADLVTVNITPEPCSLSIFALGILALRKRKT